MFMPLLAMARFNVDCTVLLAALAALLVVAAAMLAADVETAFRTALRASSIIIWSRWGASTVSSTLARCGCCECDSCSCCSCDNDEDEDGDDEPDPGLATNCPVNDPGA